MRPAGVGRPARYSQPALPVAGDGGAARRRRFADGLKRHLAHHARIHHRAIRPAEAADAVERLAVVRGMCPRLARRLALPVVAWHNGRVRSGAQLAAWRREEARRGRRSGEVRLMRPASWDRDREILRLRRSGVSCRAVARRVGCALATVASAADRLQRRAGVRGTIVGSVANPIRRDKQRRNPLADRPATRARGAADGAAVGRASADPRPDQSAATGTARRSGRMDSYGGMAGRRSERSAGPRAALSPHVRLRRVGLALLWNDGELQGDPDGLADRLKWEAARRRIPYDGRSVSAVADAALFLWRRDISSRLSGRW